MRKGLMSMLGLIATASIFVNSTKADELEEVEEPTLYEQVNQYLDINGLGKEKYRTSQYLYLSRDGELHFNIRYSFDGEKYIEQYDFTGFSRKDPIGGKLQEIYNYPLKILWKEQGYLNPRLGVNGDERLIKKEPKPNISPKSTVNLKDIEI